MSTSWGFICTSHDPELGGSYDIGGSGDRGKEILTDLWRDRAKYVALDDETADAVINNGFDKTPVWFLRAHPKCVIIILNEYGVRYDPATDTSIHPRPQHEVVRLLTELVEKAKKISPTKHMTVYVGDLEQILYRDIEGTPTKVGMKDDS